MAILVDIASHGFASWLWYGAVIRGDVETAMERGLDRMRDGSAADGWTSALIAEIDGETAGLSVGRPVSADILQEQSPHPSLAPIVALQQRVVGDWFIDSLAVYRRHRRKGIARKLLEQEVSRAGKSALSLITESHNTSALRLYQAFGFAERARLDAFKISEKSEPFQWVLLTRPQAKQGAGTHGRIL